MDRGGDESRGGESVIDRSVKKIRRMVIDVDRIVLHANRVRRHRRHGRQPNDRTGSDIEPCAVAWTLDLSPTEIALVERPPIVRTDVGDRVERAVDVADQDIIAARCPHRPGSARSVPVVVATG
jgi:hypothetical protein